MTALSDMQRAPFKFVQHVSELVSSECVLLCVFITAVPITKLFARGGGSGGHVLRETTSRGLYELVCPSRTSERGGEGYCVKEATQMDCDSRYLVLRADRVSSCPEERA